MPSVLSQDQWPKKVVGMVEKGIMDYSVEVRVKASQVLSGLLHWKPSVFLSSITETSQQSQLLDFAEFFFF